MTAKRDTTVFSNRIFNPRVHWPVPGKLTIKARLSMYHQGESDGNIFIAVNHTARQVEFEEGGVYELVIRRVG
jgi:hypothetical protein